MMEATIMNEIKYREIVKDDECRINEILRDTWQFHRDFTRDEKQATLAAQFFSYGSLALKTFGCVAEQDGKIIGFIMARNEKSKNWSKTYGWKAICSIIKLFFQRGAKDMVKIRINTLKTFSKLSKIANKKFDGEIVFFALDEKNRGLGIGKKLFSLAINYLIAEGAKNMYLYTDTLCTYQFYEKQGMTRNCAMKVKLNEKMPEIDMFLYEMELNKQY